MTKKIDAAFVQGLMQGYRHRLKALGIDEILPVVLMEILALGPEAQYHVGTRSAKLWLRDGAKYRIVYSHGDHGIALFRLKGNTNGLPVAVFKNGVTPAQVHSALTLSKIVKVKVVDGHPVFGGYVPFVGGKTAPFNAPG